MQQDQQATSNQVTTFIIGAGVFGLSLLRHINSTRPTDKVTAFDSCEKGSAINDTHKIIRTKYTSKSRTETATEALEAWLADSILKLFYHPVGRIEITDDTTKLDAIDAISTPRERLTEQSIDEHLKKVDQLSREYRCLEFAARVLKTAKDPSLYCLWNPDNAVIDWNPCIQEIRRPLQSMIREVKVEKLMVGDAGRICGVQLKGGEIVTINDGDRVVVTAGAWGEWLLKESNIAAPLKHSQAVGVFTFHLELDKVQREYLKGMPAMSFQTKGINCEFLPPLSETGPTKIGLTLPFTNKDNEPQDVAESPLIYSALLTVKRWLHKYYPELKGAELVAKEVHWDAVTKDQTPLISWHPEHRNLAVGLGASFTRAKDFPIAGRMMDEILFQNNPSDEFGWFSVPVEDRIQDNQPLLLTENLFADLNDEAAMDEEVQIFMEQGAFKYI